MDVLLFECGIHAQTTMKYLIWKHNKMQLTDIDIAEPHMSIHEYPHRIMSTSNHRKTRIFVFTVYAADKLYYVKKMYAPSNRKQMPDTRKKT